MPNISFASNEAVYEVLDETVLRKTMDDINQFEDGTYYIILTNNLTLTQETLALPKIQ